MKIDKVNGDLAFNEEQHLYFNTKYPDRKYTSVTTLIGKYHEKFGSDFWSSYKALEAIMGIDNFKPIKKLLLDFKNFDVVDLGKLGVDLTTFNETKQAILASYKLANEEACERGTKYHNAKENALYLSDRVRIEELGFPIPCQGEYLVEKHNFDLNDEYRVLPEYLVYYSSKDGILNLAGQIDVLVKDGNDIHILDYKTNAKGMEMNSYFDRKKKKAKMMYYPLSNIEDCMFQHYTLQLSLYAWMLQQINPNFNIKSLTLLHIDGEGKETTYPVEYIKEDVEKLVKHYKKQVVIDHHRETGQILKSNL